MLTSKLMLSSWSSWSPKSTKNFRNQQQTCKSSVWESGLKTFISFSIVPSRMTGTIKGVEKKVMKANYRSWRILNNIRMY